MENNFKEFIAVLARTSENKEIEELLKSLLTPAEIRDIGARWQIVKMLEQGISQRKIARELHVSLCKITRGSKELKKKNSLLKTVIQEITAQEDNA
ncbi:MAG TPA: transcriptional regulator [Caldithrix abyssi]|uniref:Transcriptional regulator n=1 Tax=Caldithrix abyssi TaxID=187145 RepID=A0A7V4WUV0_CALAY|nr:transcriptional regulator [Caldithrix abyssi]